MPVGMSRGGHVLHFRHNNHTKAPADPLLSADESADGQESFKSRFQAVFQQQAESFMILNWGSTLCGGCSSLPSEMEAFQAMLTIIRQQLGHLIMAQHETNKNAISSKKKKESWLEEDNCTRAGVKLIRKRESVSLEQWDVWAMETFYQSTRF